MPVNLLKQVLFSGHTTSLLQKSPFRFHIPCRNNANISRILASIVGDKNLSTGEAVREQHSHDESFHRSFVPKVVVWPQSVHEVCEIAKVCTAEKAHMIPFGSGSGLEGGVAPLIADVVCVNLMQIDDILKINPEDFDVTVRPGVTRKRLNHELKDAGLWFPVDPGADASLCGMCATGASGTNAMRYGTTKQNVLNLEVVLSDGTLIQTGGTRRSKKSSAGYNLTELFVGSEGTLGFITAATLRLHGLPENSRSAVCGFPTIVDAANTAIQVMQCNIPLARIEILDATAIKAINQYNPDINYAVQPTLFFEFHGSEASTQEQVERTAELADLNNGSNFVWATNQEEVNRLWYARHNAFYALQGLKAGSKFYSTDSCVPVSALAEAVEHAVNTCNEYGILTGIVGHVGDGNFHCLMVVTDQEKETAARIADIIGKKAIELGGSCTGEHGIGMGKKELLIKEVGENSVQLMRLIKKTLDPHNLMNPGKIL